ncbi:MAG: hypothetical protein Q9220_003851 [cf. Caloplaca sp. 1 TL-2023]
MKLLAVPLFELYDNTARYDEDGNVNAVTPGGEAAAAGNGTIKVLAGEGEDGARPTGDIKDEMKMEEDSKDVKAEEEEDETLDTGM